MNHPSLYIGSELTREELAELIGKHLGLAVNHYPADRVPRSVLSGLPVLRRGISPGALCVYDPAVVVDGEQVLDEYSETPLAATGYDIHCRIRAEPEEQNALVLQWFEKLKVLGMPMLLIDHKFDILGEYDP